MGTTFGTHRILVADDEPAIRKLLSLSLARTGYVVDTCPDGWAALEKVGEGIAYELLVLDVRMPRKTGLDVVLALRRAGNLIPVVLASSGFTQEDSRQAAGIPHLAFLAKPFGLHDLAVAMDRAASAGAP